MWVRHPNIIRPTLVAQKTPHGDRMDKQYKVGILWTESQTCEVEN